jgi:hypothetical protein
MRRSDEAQAQAAHTTYAWIVQVVEVEPALTPETVQTVSEDGYDPVSAAYPDPPVCVMIPPPPSAFVPAGHVAVTVFGVVLSSALVVPAIRW